MDLPSLRSRIQRHRLADSAAWRDRAVMWLAAAVAGFGVVCFTWLTDLAAALFRSLLAYGAGWPFLVTPLGAMLVVWLTRRFAAGAAGSGIPQVISAVSLPGGPAVIRRFVSAWLSLAKVVLGALALAVGFSTGREGPSVQIAAGIMLGFRRWLSGHTRITRQDLMLAGGAAGIAAAFNAPLAGVIFAIEELSRRFEQRASGVIVTSIMLSGLVSVSILGNYTYFGHINVDHLAWALLPAASVCALVAGLSGGLFSRLLIVSTQGTGDCFSAFRRAHPVWFAGACGLMLAALGFVSHGAAHGSGYQATHDVLRGDSPLPFLFAGVKFLATWLSFWSGVPGGIFAPSLAVGAGLGSDVAMLLHAELTPLIAIGMVGFLAGATQAPITAFIIVMEMIDGHAMVLSLMATALVASLLSKLISPPLYHTLSALQLAGLPDSGKGR